jgi:hypothetical protein
MEVQNILPQDSRKTVRDARDYVNKSLAIYFIAGNPTAHKFSWREEPISGLPEGKIMPPHPGFTKDGKLRVIQAPNLQPKDPSRPIHDLSCWEAIQPLVESGYIKIDKAFSSR